jgi:hypothetical protein
VQTDARTPGRAKAAADPDAGPAASTAASTAGPAASPAASTAAGPPPGADGTLLAVVPIPGTGTSLAIVGYPVTAAGTLAGVTGLLAGRFAPVDAVQAALLPAGSVRTDGMLPGQPGRGSPGQPSGELQGQPSGELQGQPSGELQGLRLDHYQRRVWADGTEVPLTFQEFELLAFLVTHPATVFSRADLVREVWQRDFAADSRTVDVHVSRLRHKLGPAYGRCLVTEYRVGYQFRP